MMLKNKEYIKFLNDNPKRQPLVGEIPWAKLPSPAVIEKKLKELEEKK